MSTGYITLIVLELCVLGFFLGRARALATSKATGKKLHSLPNDYGQAVALFTAIPALLLMLAWLFLQPLMIEGRIGGMISDSVIPEGGAKSLVMADVRRIADGLDALMLAGHMSGADLDAMRADFTDMRNRLGNVGVALGSDVPVPVFEAAKDLRKSQNAGNFLMTLAVLGLSLGLLAWSWSWVHPDQRVRNTSETMIVVMGAGAAAKLGLNPLEAMTTITVKIVSQLTGDTEFASPETLVAFALGLTLFVFTPGLNVIAPVIARKYPEQYE